MLIKYVKDRKGRRIGAIVAELRPETGIVGIGTSLTNTKAGDVFDPIEAIRIAENNSYFLRMNLNPPIKHTYPPSLKKEVRRMVRRASLYYRDDFAGIITGIPQKPKQEETHEKIAG